MPQPYLSPKDTEQNRRTAYFESPTVQANEHDEQQDDIGRERDNDIKFVINCVWHNAGVCCSRPFTAELWAGLW